ncbi:nucleoside phosphorylase [Kribbella sp. NPDC026611]|uniref:nucleoside phosphorylase n=1 Tax=Kribbella sp. NPDC026611 TaxID=3154911 RepID=UPI0033D39635
MQIPLLEDDTDQPGILEPAELYRPNGAPPRAVMCFFNEVVEYAGGTLHARFTSQEHRPVYTTTRNGVEIAYFYPGIGAPSASISMEEAIVMGCRDFVAVGGAGALLPELKLGEVLIADQALRDEGTSYHYLEASSRFVSADEVVNAAIAQALQAAGVPYRRGTTWTTDAIFREPRSRLERRVLEGCSTVEMEAAAFFAVAQYRGVRVGQLLYAGDALAGDKWDSRDWMQATDVRTALFEVALDAASRL